MKKGTSSIYLSVIFAVNALVCSCNQGAYSKRFRIKATVIRCEAIATEIARFDVDLSNFVIELCQKGVNKQFFVPMTKEYDRARNTPNQFSDNQLARISPYEAKMLTDRIFVVYDAKTWRGRAFYAIAVKNYGVVENGQCSRNDLPDILENLDPQNILSKTKIP